MHLYEEIHQQEELLIKSDSNQVESESLHWSEQMNTTHEWSRTVQGEKKSWCWYSCVFKWNAICFIFHLGVKTLEMTMGCGFCCCVSSLPVLYFLLLVTGWFSFLLQGQLAQSRWSPDTVIDQQQSGRARRSVQNTQSFRRRADALTLCQRVSSWTSHSFPSPLKNLVFK